MKTKMPPIRLNYYFLCLIIFSLTFFTNTYGQNHHERFNALDVLHYRFEINLNDSTDHFEADAIITIKFKKDLRSFVLDLSNLNENHKGMIINQISMDRHKLEYSHKNDQIEIKVNVSEGETKSFHIQYHGIPFDGLIISDNIFGERTFFGDNWPNRAHNWLPTVDHPSDKASVEFIVQAPKHYQVVAVGLNIGERFTESTIISHWKTSLPLPTKVMVIGVAEFAVQNIENYKGTQISSWVYPENRDEGFLDYSVAIKPMKFFSTHIASFPFAKLANVQSKTRYGGMENAGCIFYHERSVSGKQQVESLIAHEIAHQWFGDAISEHNWHHIWISEGFATYFTNLYTENQYGKEKFLRSMKQSRDRVIKYSKRNLAPIIDTTLKVSTKLLSTNSYQKGAWFLHMLRNELGESLFWDIIQTYFKKYEHKNVLTEDFQAVVESLSAKDFDNFFNQWLYQKGHPVLSLKWDYKSGRINLNLKQYQKHFSFTFPIELEILYEDGSTGIQLLSVDNADFKFSIFSDLKPIEIKMDPNTNLLFESK